VAGETPPAATVVAVLVAVSITDMLLLPLLATYTLRPSGVIPMPYGLFWTAMGAPMKVLVTASSTLTVPLPKPPT
jgi:hypothetical protein